MCWHQWPLASTACLVVISFCPNPSTSLYLSLHICAARLLPLRLWPAWRLHITEQARPIPLHFPHHQGPSCRASTQCSSRTATISFYFDLRTAQSFSRFSSLAVNLANDFPKCNLHHAALKHTLHSRRCVDSLERSACAFFSLPLPSTYKRIISYLD